jgi:transposase
MTCWRRLRDWQEAGVSHAFHRALLDRLGRAGLIDWSRCSLDAASLPAKAGGTATGPNPTDRGKSGSKRHLVVDRQGIPLAVLLTAANVHDSVVLEEVLDRVPPVRQPRGRPRRRPRQAARRQGLRLRALPPRLPEARHRPAHRAARNREQRAVGPAQVGGRTHVGPWERRSQAPGSGGSPSAMSGGLTSSKPSTYSPPA